MRLSSTCLVSVARNRYSVPCELTGQLVSTQLLYSHSVVVVADDLVTTRALFHHPIPLDEVAAAKLARNAEPMSDKGFPE